MGSGNLCWYLFRVDLAGFVSCRYLHSSSWLIVRDLCVDIFGLYGIVGYADHDAVSSGGGAPRLSWLAFGSPVSKAAKFEL